MTRPRLLLALLAAAALLLAADAYAQGVLDGMTSSYRGAWTGWMDRLLPVAQRTFALLAALEFAVAGAVWMLRGDLGEAASGFVLKFAFLAFCFALVLSFELWIPPIVDGFLVAGRLGAGGLVLSPSSVIDLGDRVSTEIVEGWAQGWSVVNPVAWLTVGSIALLVYLCFIGIAAMLAYALIEAYLVLGVGVVFLPAVAFRGTAWLAEGYLAWVFRSGIRVFFVHLIVGLGGTLAQTWAASLRAAANPLDLTPVGEVLAGSVVFLALAVGLPVSASGILTSRASFGLVNAVRAGR